MAPTLTEAAGDRRRMPSPAAMRGRRRRRVGVRAAAATKGENFETRVRPAILERESGDAARERERERGALDKP